MDAWPHPVLAVHDHPISGRKSGVEVWSGPVRTRDRPHFDGSILLDQKRELLFGDHLHHRIEDYRAVANIELQPSIHKFAGPEPIAPSEKLP